MQNTRELDVGTQHGFTSDRDQYVNETPYIEKPLSGSEEFIEIAGHLEHNPGELVNPKQEYNTNGTIEQEFRRMINEAMADAPKKKVWRSTGIDLTKLNIEIAEPYKVIMESAVTGDFDIFPQLQKDICSYFGMAMYRWATVNKDYMALITAMRSLYWIAEDGGEVIIETDVAGYDYGKVIIGLNLISGKALAKNSITWNKLTLYPVVNLPVMVKKDNIYTPLMEIYPNFLKVIKRMGCMLYLTSDFNLAIDKRLHDDKEVKEALEQYWQMGHYQFRRGLKLYLIG